MLRLHSLNNISGFRNAARPKKEELVRAITNNIAPHCNYEMDLIYPPRKSIQAILTPSHPYFLKPQPKVHLLKIIQSPREKELRFQNHLQQSKT